MKKLRNKIKNRLKKIKILRKLIIWIKILLNYSLDPKNVHLNNERPWIVEESTEWLKNFLKKDMSVFEWGSGGSTIFIAKRVRKIITVEHDYEWFLKIQLCVKLNSVSNCQCKFIQPEEDSSYVLYKSTNERLINHNFKKYCEAIDSFPDNYFDLIFIDGRARNYCIMHAKNKVKMNGFILLDNSDRKNYQYGIDLLCDWKRTDFLGPTWTTSIFQKK